MWLFWVISKDFWKLFVWLVACYLSCVLWAFCTIYFKLSVWFVVSYCMVYCDILGVGCAIYCNIIFLCVWLWQVICVVYSEHSVSFIWVICTVYCQLRVIASYLCCLFKLSADWFNFSVVCLRFLASYVCGLLPVSMGLLRVICMASFELFVWLIASCLCHFASFLYG